MGDACIYCVYAILCLLHVIWCNYICIYPFISVKYVIAIMGLPAAAPMIEWLFEQSEQELFYNVGVFASGSIIVKIHFKANSLSNYL